MRSGYVRGIANLSVISALAGLLAACGGGGMSLGNFGSSSSPVTTEPGVEPEMPATIKSQELVGKWGLASFQNPNDRARTEKQAAAQCKQPYVIGAGQSGGDLEELCARHRRRGIHPALAAARHPSMGKIHHPRRARKVSARQPPRHHRADRRRLQPLRRQMEPLLRHRRELHGDRRRDGVISLFASPRVRGEAASHRKMRCG